MKPWREQLRLAQPLRGVRLTRTSSARDEAERQTREREAAAFERGRQAGEQALSEQLLRQRQEIGELQRGVLDSLTQCVPRLLREAEAILIELALEAARKWMAGQPIDAPAVEACVREALAQMEEATEFNVLLNADDLALLEQHRSTLVEPESGATRIHVAASPEVTRGGCLVQTRFGTVDARREIKVALLQDALR